MRPDVHATFERPEPYDIHGTLRFLRLGSRDPALRRLDHGIARAVLTAEGPATLEVGQDGEALFARAWGPGAEAAVAGASDLLGLGDDPTAFTPEHVVLRRLQARHAGLHLSRVSGALDALVPVVFQQLVTWIEAAASWRRVVTELGEPAPGPHALVLPPTPEALRGARSWVYERAGLGAKRGRTLRALGHHARRLEEAWQAGPEEARRVWRAVPGIGPWTIEHALGVRGGEPDAVSPGDFHLPNTVAWALAREERADDARMFELLEPFRPHRGRVVLLLLQAGVEAPKRGPKRRVR